MTTSQELILLDVQQRVGRVEEQLGALEETLQGDGRGNLGYWQKVSIMWKIHIVWPIVIVSMFFGAVLTALIQHWPQK